jgi:hypothetical protein
MEDIQEVDQAACIYEIDARDQIVWCNGEWDRFAETNGAEPNIFSAAVKDKLIWDFISDSATAELYKRLVALVRAGDTVDFPFRCDSRRIRRLLNMTISQTADGNIRFLTRLKSEESKAAPLESDSDLRVMVLCSWCGAAKIGIDSWLGLGMAMQESKVFEGRSVRPLSHGICPVCHAQMELLINQKESQS